MYWGDAAYKVAQNNFILKKDAGPVDSCYWSNTEDMVLERGNLIPITPFSHKGTISCV